ncbi:GGDEF domain-containing protein [Vibrio sp. CAU 1672]|nr:GGDEF domain-containing protein [Vibrio sp. CAU 1672]
MKTTITIYVLVNYACTYILAQIWFQNKSKFSGLSLILIDFVLQSVGMTLAIFHGVLPVFFSVAIANIMMFSGAVLFLFGLALFLDLKVNRLAYYIYVCVFASIYIFSIYYQPFFWVRILIFNGMLIPVFIHVLYLIYFASSFENRKHGSSTGFAIVLFLLLTLVRFYFAVSSENLTDYFNSYIMDNLLVALSILCTILLTFSLHLMINKKLYSQIEKLAITDPLTQACNRRKIEEIIKNEIERYSRCGMQFCIILADIDNFKRFNDTYGHDVGDKALVHVVDILNKNIRRYDTVGRWGGEEFVIVLPGSDLQNAANIADRLVKSVNVNTIDVKGESVAVSISLGLAEYKKTSTFESVIRDADIALYKAKGNGRNRYELYCGDVKCLIV